MNDLPRRVLDPLLRDDEQVSGSLLTAGQRAYIDPDRTEHVHPIWFVCTQTRAWLIAEGPGLGWAVATGRPLEVRVQRGWTRDQLHLGGHGAPLRRGTRQAAEQLVTRWAAADGGGPAHLPEPLTIPPERAPIARGADDVPEWVAQQVFAPHGSQWLHGARTQSQHPFNTAQGTIVRANIWVLHSDRSAALAAVAPDGTAWQTALQHPMERLARPGSDRLTAGPWVLWGPPLTDRRVEVASTLSTAGSPGHRWTTLARALLDDGHVRRSVRIAAGALTADHGEVWSVVARLLFKAGARELSAGAASRALALDPTLDVAAEVATWTRASDTLQLRREDVDLSFIRGSMRAAIASLGEPVPPPGLPWPPRRPDAVWAAALAMQDRFADAGALWEDRNETALSLAALAALKSAEGSDDTAEAWQDAAEALRSSDPPAAPAALERAIATDPTAARLWLRAAWAWQDGDGVTARRYWLAAVAQDPLGQHRVQLPADAWRVVAQHAEAEGAWAAAAAAWHAATQADPTEPEAWRRAAITLDTRLHRPADAADVLSAYLERHEQFDPIPEARWQIRRDLADLQLRAARPDDAAETLRQLVAGDYLHPNAMLAAITLGEQLDVLPLRWWRHLHAVLDSGGDAGDPHTPRASLSMDELEALHPGGVSFMERLRQGLTGAEAPNRATLVRGLERIGTDSHPEVWTAVVELCAALELAPPDVYVFRGDGAWGCSAWATRPPLLLVGAEHLRVGARQLPDAAMRFLLAVELVHLACEHPVLTFDTDLMATSRSLYSAFGKYSGTAESIVDVVSLVPGIDQLSKLQTIIGLSRRVFTTRSVIDKASGVAGPVLERLGLGGESEAGGVGRAGLEGAALSFRVQADRAALLLVGDLHAAVGAILSASPDLDGAQRVSRAGLATLLSDDPPAESLRLTALLAYAATLE